MVSPMCSDICRICHCQYDDLENHIHDQDPKPHPLWSVQEYDRIVEALEDELEVSQTAEFESSGLASSEQEEEDDSADSDDDESEADQADHSEFDQGEPLDKRGIKSSCPLNVLESFHSVWGFPPDVMHDVFEGKVKVRLNISFCHQPIYKSSFADQIFVSVPAH